MRRLGNGEEECGGENEPSRHRNIDFVGGRNFPVKYYEEKKPDFLWKSGLFTCKLNHFGTVTQAPEISIMVQKVGGAG